MKKNNFYLYCLSLSNNNFEKIKKFDYLPVGVGKVDFDNRWIRENTGLNISNKNEFYGELTFHYWFWKNILAKKKIKNEWFGFCHYRRFWNQKNMNHLKKVNNIDNLVLKKIPTEWKKKETILVKPYFINNLKLSKLFKRGFKLALKNPNLITNKLHRNIKFHFDMWHGYKNLDRAIELLDKKNQSNFHEFVNNEHSFNPFHMYFSKYPEISTEYYNTVFIWLKKCEKIFGFDKDAKYDTKRIYAFLAERFMSYWFKKNTNYLEWSITHYDISN